MNIDQQGLARRLGVAAGARQSLKAAVLLRPAPRASLRACGMRPPGPGTGRLLQCLDELPRL